METKTSTIDPKEVEQFSRIADEWWDPHGKFKPLHDINPLRVNYIKDRIEQHFGKSEGLSLVDIGCGGGLIAEPFAKAGFNVSAIDASEKNIAVAKLHAEQSGADIDYQSTSAEALVETGTQFDVVLALEIIEHVASVPAFVEATSQLVKPGGLLVYSTINRTFKSYAFAIIGAEYILRMVPRGTHEWSKFLRPSEIVREMQKNDIELSEMTGMVLNKLAWKWELNPRDLDVNYLVCGKKPI